MRALRFVSLALVAGCLPPLARPVANVTDLRYRSRSAPSTTIQLYGWVGSRSSSVGSRCKMIPTDSQMFAVRAQQCGGLAAWYWGVSRLLLEQASSSAFTAPMRLDDRWRWLDLPSDRCTP